MIVNVWDMDGTLCESIFSNARLQNDNGNARTEEFLRDLANVKPFAWANAFNPRFAGINIIVTGRLPQHEAISRSWFERITGQRVDGFVSVAWDDSLQTREDSYVDYVNRKVKILAGIIHAWHAVAGSCHAGVIVRVHEDDSNVLADLATCQIRDTELYIVRDGKLPERYSAAPKAMAGDICECGHPRSDHEPGIGCTREDDDVLEALCPCGKFQARALDYKKKEGAPSPDICECRHPRSSHRQDDLGRVRCGDCFDPDHDYNEGTENTRFITKLIRLAHEPAIEPPCRRMDAKIIVAIIVMAAYTMLGLYGAVVISPWFMSCLVIDLLLPIVYIMDKQKEGIA